MNKMPGICHRCKQPIHETSKSAAGRQWHPDCYWCDACRHGLDYASVYYGNEILCLDCFTEKSVCAERDAKCCKFVSPPTSMHNGFLKKPWEQIYHTTVTEDGVRVHHFAPCSGLRFSVQPRRPPPPRAAAAHAYRSAQKQQQAASAPAAPAPAPPPLLVHHARALSGPPSSVDTTSAATEPPCVAHEYQRLRDTTSAPDTRRGRSPREVLRSDERREAAWNKFAEWLSPETPPQEAPPPHLVLPVPPPPRPPRYSPCKSPYRSHSYRRSRSPSRPQSVPSHPRDASSAHRNALRASQSPPPPPPLPALLHQAPTATFGAPPPSSRGGSRCSSAGAASVGSRLGGKGPGCRRCGKTVFHAERMLASGGVFHNTCFSCRDCKKPLEVTTMFEGSGEIFCKPCGTRKFGPVGYGYGGGAGALQTM